MVGDGGHFCSVRGARSGRYRAYLSDERQRNGQKGPRPAGLGAISPEEMASVGSPWRLLFRSQRRPFLCVDTAWGRSFADEGTRRKTAAAQATAPRTHANSIRKTRNLLIGITGTAGLLASSRMTENRAGGCSTNGVTCAAFVGPCRPRPMRKRRSPVPERL